MAVNQELKRVLVTRPEKQNKKIIADLVANGYFPEIMPMLSCRPLTQAQDSQAYTQTQVVLSSLSEADHIVFISTNAVDFGVPLLEDAGSSWPSKAAYYAIGQATYDALLAAVPDACHAVMTRAMNSEGLLKLNSLQQINKHKVIIFRGIGGRTFLGQQLAKRGAKISYAQSYVREVVQHSMSRWHQIAGYNWHALAFNSGETIDAFIQQAQQYADHDFWCTVPTIVPSKRVKSIARQHRFERVVLADNASDLAVMSAIHRL